MTTSLVNSEKVNKLCKKHVKANQTTFAALADKLELSEVSLWKKRKGYVEWTASEAFALADLIGCNVNDFRS